MVEALKALANWLAIRRLRAERKKCKSSEAERDLRNIRPDSEAEGASLFRALILVFARRGVQPFFG
jgi:hypothetical protein